MTYAYNSTLKPSAKPMQRSPMKRRAPKAKPGKSGLLRSIEHRQNVASLPCAKCGIVGFSQAAHVNAGVAGKGMGLKTCDSLTFPLCCTRIGIVGCHAEHDQGGIYTREERARIEWEFVDATRAQLIRMNKWPAHVEAAYQKAIQPLARMVHPEQKESQTSVAADSGVAHISKGV